MRVTLVGASGFGRYHLQYWLRHPSVDGVTVVGRDAGRLAAVAAEFGVGTATDLQAAVDQVDVVDVCTPPDTHAAVARVSLGVGVPTIVEKPPCRTADEAVALWHQAGGTPLFCVMNQRFAPVWRRARELVAEGTVGRPLLSLWPVLTDQRGLMSGGDFRSDAARGGGALLDGAFHLAYLVPYLLAAPIRAVTAWAGRLAVQPPAGEDTGLATWEVGDGVAQLVYSWAVADPPRTPAATIVGDEATLLVPRSAKQPIELVRDREATELDLGSYRTMPRNDLGNCLGHYLDCIVAHTDPEATWDEAVTAQRVIEATERAAAEGRRLEIPPCEPCSGATEP